MFLVERLSNLFEFTCFMDSGDGGGGGASDTTEPDDDKENKDDKEVEKITLTKAEYEEKLKQKFAEGARKAQQGKLDDKKDDTNENKDKANNTDNDILSIKQELELLKAEKIAGKVGIKTDFQEDLVALVRGKGLELTEENIKKEAERHKEWFTQNDGGSGTRRLGSTDGDTTPPKASEEEQASKMFGL